MPSLSPLTSGQPQHVLQLALTPTNLLVHALVKEKLCTPQPRTCPRRPVTPARARTRSRARQSTRSPRRLRPLLDLCFRQETRQDTSSLPDMVISAPVPCSRRHRRRLSPRYCKLASPSCSPRTTVFCAIKLVVIAVMYRTPLRHRPLPSATVSSSPWST